MTDTKFPNGELLQAKHFYGSNIAVVNIVSIINDVFAELLRI